MSILKLDLDNISETDFINIILGKFFTTLYLGDENLKRIFGSQIVSFLDTRDRLSNIVEILYLENNIKNSKYISIEFKEEDVKPDVLKYVTWFSVKFENIKINEGFINDKNTKMLLLLESEKITEDYINKTIVLNNGEDFKISFDKQKIYFKQNPFVTFSEFKRYRINEKFQIENILNLHLINAKYINKKDKNITSEIFNFITKSNNVLSDKYYETLVNSSKFSNSYFKRKFLNDVIEKIFDIDLTINKNAVRLLLPSNLINSTLTGISIPKELLRRRNNSLYTSDLLFKNEEVPLYIVGDEVFFEIEGDSADVIDFWLQVRYRGISNPPNLKTLMENYYGIPLPSTINPMNFLLRHILRNGWRILLVNNNYIKKIESIKLLGILTKLFWSKNLGLLVILDKGYKTVSFLGEDPFVGHKLFNEIEENSVSINFRVASPLTLDILEFTESINFNFLMEQASIAIPISQVLDYIFDVSQSNINISPNIQNLDILIELLQPFIFSDMITVHANTLNYTFNLLTTFPTIRINTVLNCTFNILSPTIIT